MEVNTIGILLAGGWVFIPLPRDGPSLSAFWRYLSIIDVTLSNCINSGLRKIFIFTQYRPVPRAVTSSWLV
jgi:glucose-1-phosphate adenylyltransferase